MAAPERIVPDEEEPGIVALHLKRYEFALPLCRGKEVLDAGCGVGYGTALLAQEAARAVGVDIDAQALAYARERYRAANLEFRRMDLLDLDFADASFDVVCSFEAIEHLAHRDAFLAGAARLLRPGGALVVSTPRAERTTERPSNPHHRVEYSREDFEALLRRHFRHVELYGQRRLQTRRHRLAQRLDVFGLRRRVGFLRSAGRVLGTAPTSKVTSEGIVIERDGLDRATELVAVCR